MDELSTYLTIIPAAPLLAALVIPLLAPRWLRSLKMFPPAACIAALAVSSVCSLLLLWEVGHQHDHLGPARPHFQRIITLWTWADIREAYYQPPRPPSEAAPAADALGGSRDFAIEIALRADGLTAMMLAMVTFVSLLVAIFAVGYMHGDRSIWRFFTYISLFVFSMTMLVSASNFVLLYVFWEAVGVCSYLLIGFWYDKPAAAAAGKKAFLVNRIGDFGFALALFLIWTTYGTLNYHSTAESTGGAAAGQRTPIDSMHAAEDGDRVVSGVLDRAPQDYRGGGVGLAICLLLLVGACGKSAQFPLHVWLPDAMEGPTPVSALIHAATMVTAGVYMITRCTPLFMAAPDAQLIVAAVGTVTALLAALIALSQFDLKRVLAYSTISQLGFMFLGLGTGVFAGITAGMFHLLTHAFFKALLFLGAGSVMHAMGNVIDMRRFGGLRRIMSVTHWTFLIGCLALAGIFPFAGFWSKDAIVGAVHDRAESLSGHSGGHTAAAESSSHGADFMLVSPETAGDLYHWFYYAALLTALLTAFYTFRAFYMTFYGPLRTPPEAHGHAHESPPVMTVPLIVLAMFAVTIGGALDQTYVSTAQSLAGGVTSTGNSLSDLLGYTPQLAGSLAATRTGPAFHTGVAAISLLLALAGIGLAAFFYLEDRREVEWLARFLRFQWTSRLLDSDMYARVRNRPWVVSLYRQAGRLHLAWLVTLAGRLAALLVWIISAPLILTSFASPYRLSANKFYLDELYDWTIVRPLRWLAAGCYAVDRWLIDGLVNLCGQVPVLVGGLMRSLQMGLVQFYALSMALGVLLLVLVRVLWG